MTYTTEENAFGGYQVIAICMCPAVIIVSNKILADTGPVPPKTTLWNMPSDFQREHAHMKWRVASFFEPQLDKLISPYWHCDCQHKRGLERRPGYSLDMTCTVLTFQNDSWLVELLIDGSFSNLLVVWRSLGQPMLIQVIPTRGINVCTVIHACTVKI